ncbi:MAG TPA: DUF4911 domain-containing protein [Geobacteraceae bacterium]|nr:DUF4911 domain-containing protein [Geobacteraceae bacterium]
MFETQARYFRVDRHVLVYLKFILEAYDGLAVLSTVEREEAVVRVACPSCSDADVDLLLRALAEEIDMAEVPQPPGCAGILPAMNTGKGARFAG